MLTKPASSYRPIGIVTPRTSVSSKARGVNLGEHLSATILAAMDEKNIGGKLLEIGCGNGALAKGFAAVFSEVVALDKMLERHPIQHNRYRERAIRYIAADFEKFEFDKQEKFDVLICSFAAHHFDLDSSLTKMKALLRPRGEIIIVDLYAQRRTNLFLYLIDQLAISQLKFFLLPLYSRTRLRARNAFRFYRDRIRFLLQKGGIKHVIEDLKNNRPPSLQTWCISFDDCIPDGQLSILAGSVFMYRWQANAIRQPASAQ